MKYKTEHPSGKIEKALGLDDSQIKRLDSAIHNAYVIKGARFIPKIDSIFGNVAPYIETPEEAFYVACKLLIDVYKVVDNFEKKISKNVN